MPGGPALPETLAGLGRYNCERFGEFVSLIYEFPGQERQYTNTQVDAEANRLAHALLGLGVRKGDRVLVMMQNCPEVLIGYQALARIGAITIPVLPLLKPPEVAYLAANAQPVAILTSTWVQHVAEEGLKDAPSMKQMIVVGLEGTPQAPAPAPPGTAAVQAGVVPVPPASVPANAAPGQRVPAEAQRGVAPQDHPPAPPGTAAVQAAPAPKDAAALQAEGYTVHGYAALVAGRPDAPPAVTVLPTDPAVILYTSGTTGRPKGVLLSHRNLLSNALTAAGDPAEQVGGARVLAVLPLAHAFGITASNVAYLTGTVGVMVPRFDLEQVFQLIQKHRIAGIAMVPAMIVGMLNFADAQKYDTSSLEYIVSGSAPLPVSVLEGFEQRFHCPIREGYGLSEATTAVSGHGSEMVRNPGSVGKPLPGIEVRVVDEHDQDVPTGELGELLVRGPNLMQEYYHLPEETAKALRGGWLYTGDMAKLDADGYIYIMERKKDLIIRGGLNVYPRDAEEVLQRHPAVLECAVVGVPSARLGEEVLAYVVLQPGKQATPEELIAFCQESLANYKTPAYIEFIPALPRNAIGKIDRKILRAKRQ